jgi:hypothetical protein
MLVRAEVRDFRRPCAEEGRPGEAVPDAGDAKSAGGEEGVHCLPSRSAVNYITEVQNISSLSAALDECTHSTYLILVLRSRPTVVCLMRAHTLRIPTFLRGRVCAHEFFEWRVSAELCTRRAILYPQLDFSSCIEITITFEHTFMRRICSSCHVSIDTERTKLRSQHSTLSTSHHRIVLRKAQNAAMHLICTPNPRCVPAHCRHKNTAKLMCDSRRRAVSNSRVNFTAKRSRT